MTEGTDSAPARTGAHQPPVQTPRRVVTGRNKSGKSVFRSFEVTPKTVELGSGQGLVFWEMYATDGTPTLSGVEPDPMATNRPAFPGPNGTYFRVVKFPAHPPEGCKPAPDAFDRFIRDASEKLPGWVEHAHYEREQPGMHTTDTVDYGIVISGEILLELDDGKTVHLRQGDCIVQNGTRHRWRNPGPCPCLMAFVLIGGRREA